MRHAEKEWIKLNLIDDDNLDYKMNGEYESGEPSHKTQESENETIHDENGSTSNASQDWQTEGDSPEAHVFMDEENEDVSDHDELYDASRNIMTENNLANGFRSIMEKYMKQLSKKLRVLAALANASEQRPESKNESEDNNNEDDFAEKSIEEINKDK